MNLLWYKFPSISLHPFKITSGCSKTKQTKPHFFVSRPTITIFIQQPPLICSSLQPLTPSSQQNQSNFDIKITALMKETRNKNINIGYVPTKSNISSLKAIMNQGRIPLSQYINEKPVKTDTSSQNLSYFDKMRAMLNKGETRLPPQQQKAKEQQKRPPQSRLQILCKNQSLKEFINEYQIPKKMNFNKEKLETYDPRWKDRSKSVNARSLPKNEKGKRLETACNNSIKAANTEHFVRGHHKTYTQIEAHYQSEKPQTPQLHRYKSVKKEIINYTKFTTIYTNGQIEAGIAELNETIGLGANATVRLGKDIKSQRQFAVKIYEKYKLIEPIRKRRVMQEIDILGRIKHQNIIKMYSCYQDKRQIHLLFEYLPSAETLQDYLRSHLYDTTMDQKDLIAMKIIESISYLHENGIFHRDIKTDNIMIGQNKEIKLIDFGFATTATKGETHCGTPNYMAPELFSKKSIYSPMKVDIWALGILLYYLYEGCYPFRGYDEKDLSRNASLGMFGYKKCNNRMQAVIDCALRVDPSQRKSLKEIEELMKDKTLI